MKPISRLMTALLLAGSATAFAGTSVLEWISSQTGMKNRCTHGSQITVAITRLKPETMIG